MASLTVLCPVYQGQRVHVLSEHDLVLGLGPQEAAEAGHKLTGAGSGLGPRLPAPQHHLPVHRVSMVNQVSELRSLQPLSVQYLEFCLLVRIKSVRFVPEGEDLPESDTETPDIRLE